MSYHHRQKERKVKKTIAKIFQLFYFKSNHISFGGKIVLFGNFSLLLSLFLPWVVQNSELRQWNAFSSVSGNVGYLMILIILSNFFFILSTHKKEMLKLHTKISFQNHFIILLLGIFIIGANLLTLSSINGLQTFAEDILYGKGLILSISSGILIIFGGYLLKKEFLQYSLATFHDDQTEESTPSTSDNNMKLPF